MPNLEALARAAIDEEITEPPPVEQLRRRSGRRRRRIAGLATMTLAVVVAGIAYTTHDEDNTKVFVGEVSTTTTTTPLRALRLHPTVWPDGLDESFTRSVDLNISFSGPTGTDPHSIAVSLRAPGAARAALPYEVVYSQLYTRGSVGQADYRALALVVWVPTEGEAKPTGDQRQLGDRLVTWSARRVRAGKGLSVNATSVAWREAEYAVLVLAIRVNDADLQAFVDGLVVQRGPGREFIPINEPVANPSEDPAMIFAQQTGWMPVACPSTVRDSVGPDNGVCGYIYDDDKWTDRQRFDVVDAEGNLVGHLGGPQGGGFVPLED
jgi:hypothetical protein